MGKKVLMVGWHPDFVNYTKYPGLMPEKLEAGLVVMLGAGVRKVDEHAPLARNAFNTGPPDSDAAVQRWG